MDISPDLRSRAAALHKSCLVADAHYDLLSIVFQKRTSQGKRRVIESEYLPKLKAGGVDLLICSLFVDDRYLPEMGLRNALDQVACLYEELSESGDVLALCRTSAEIRRARAEGKLAILLSLEGVDPLGNDLSLLRIFHSLGVRGVGLTWSRRNYAADGCFFRPVEEGTKGGLTNWGVELVSEAERLGMYIDVSHLNDEGFWDLCKLSKRPFMASHSNCRALTPVMRNLDDEQIKELAGRGGVMGMNCCCSFVRLAEGSEATVVELALHGEHVRRIGGAGALCFGFDFCDEIRAAEGKNSNDCFPYYDEAYKLTEQLIARGFSDEEVKGVLGENMLAFLARTIG